MRLQVFVNDNINVLKKLKSILDSNAIKIESEFSSKDKPYVGHSFINGNEAIYFKINQRSFLSDNQKEVIESIFPITLKDNEDIYTFKLMSIFDYDWDDDRYWYPSISFTAAKNGKLV
jgi:hypothetical protein